MYLRIRAKECVAYLPWLPAAGLSRRHINEPLEGACQVSDVDFVVAEGSASRKSMQAVGTTQCCLSPLTYITPNLRAKG